MTVTTTNTLGLLVLLVQIILIICKLSGLITQPWWIIAAPVLAVIIVYIGFIIACLWEMRR